MITQEHPNKTSPRLVRIGIEASLSTFANEHPNKTSHLPPSHFLPSHLPKQKLGWEDLVLLLIPSVNQPSKNSHETDLEMSPRPLGTTIFKEL